MTTQLPRVAVSDGTLEALKWQALLLMVADHTNKYLLHDASHTLFNAGRIAMPSSFLCWLIIWLGQMRISKAHIAEP